MLGFMIVMFSKVTQLSNIIKKDINKNHEKLNGLNSNKSFSETDSIKLGNIDDSSIINSSSPKKLTFSITKENNSRSEIDQI